MAKPSEQAVRERIARNKSFDPFLTMLNYDTDIIHYLNYHNVNTDEKTRRNWLSNYLGNDKLVADKATDFEIKSVAVLARAKMRGDFISDKHEEYLKNTLEKLKEKYSNKKTIEKIIKEPTKEDVSKRIIASIQGLVDDFIVDSKIFDIRAIDTNGSKKEDNEKILSFLKKQEKEFSELVNGKDQQLVEGYSNLNRVKQKKMVFLFQDLIKQFSEIKREPVIRKERKKKEKPASVLVSKLKYQKSFTGLDLTSESPTKIIGCSEVWIYDTEKRKISVYLAGEDKISVKGTTIIGFDENTSLCKILRKPEQIISIVKGSLARKTLMLNFTNVKSKEYEANGRMNENCIILKVF
jgi:hypothetical protein